MRKVTRKEIALFMNTTPKETTKTMSLLGKGVTTATYTYNANTSSETFICDDNATQTVDNYEVSIDGEQYVLFGDPCFDYINNLRRQLATGDDATTTVYLVDKYDHNDKTPIEYIAQEFEASVTISSYGGDGGQTPKIGFTIALNGTPKNGAVTIAEGVPTFIAGTV